jgi:hypothetical protein
LGLAVTNELQFQGFKRITRIAPLPGERFAARVTERSDLIASEIL